MCLFFQVLTFVNIYIKSKLQIFVYKIGVQKMSALQYAGINIVLLKILFQVNYLNTIKYLNFITKYNSFELLLLSHFQYLILQFMKSVVITKQNAFTPVFLSFWDNNNKYYVHLKILILWTIFKNFQPVQTQQENRKLINIYNENTF